MRSKGERPQKMDFTAQDMIIWLPLIRRLKDVYRSCISITEIPIDVLRLIISMHFDLYSLDTIYEFIRPCTFSSFAQYRAPPSKINIVFHLSMNKGTLYVDFELTHPIMKIEVILLLQRPISEFLVIHTYGGYAIDMKSAPTTLHEIISKYNKKVRHIGKYRGKRLDEQQQLEYVLWEEENVDETDPVQKIFDSARGISKFMRIHPYATAKRHPSGYVYLMKPYLCRFS